MDPSRIQALAESADRYNLKVDGVGGFSGLHNSDVESSTEIGNSDSEVNTEDSPRTIVDSESEKSVHIIFLSDSVSNADSVNTGIKIEGTPLSCDDGGKPLLRLSPTQLPASTGSYETSCLSEVIELSGEESGVCLENIPVSEVEDDFDVSEGMVFEVERRPRDSNPRKRKKKKFFKVCKACGELVERKDLISHIKEHKRRKLELASNSHHSKNVHAVENVNSHSRKYSNSSQTMASLVDCGIQKAEIIPESSLSNLLADRPFKCSVCSETFRTQSSLTIHFKSHSGDCSNSCPVS